MSFNPATFGFVDVTSAKQAQRLGHEDDVPAAPYRRASIPFGGKTYTIDAVVTHLEQAAARFALRRDDFARGKDATCCDLAAKLDRFGGFVSDKQAEFAYKLIGWSVGYGKPHPMEAPAEAPGRPVAASKPADPTVTLPKLPKLFDLMQRLSKLAIADVTIARKNQDSLCWVKVKVKGIDSVVGKIENGQLHLFRSRMGPFQASDVLATLIRIEADPEAAAVQHGKASGRCSICSRDLTDPVSIERGIGPICIGKAGW